MERGCPISKETDMMGWFQLKLIMTTQWRVQQSMSDQLNHSVINDRQIPNNWNVFHNMIVSKITWQILANMWGLIDSAAMPLRVWAESVT